MIILSEVTWCLVRDFNVFLFPLERLCTAMYSVEG